MTSRDVQTFAASVCSPTLSMFTCSVRAKFFFKKAQLSRLLLWRFDSFPLQTGQSLNFTKFRFELFLESGTKTSLGQFFLF